MNYTETIIRRIDSYVSDVIWWDGITEPTVIAQAIDRTLESEDLYLLARHVLDPMTPIRDVGPKVQKWIREKAKESIKSRRTK